MEIVHQLASLVIAALPTVVIVLLFYFFLRWAFFTPILKAMAERKARIEGARAEAVAGEASAKHELDTYNEAMRKARQEIYGQQEAARQTVLDERGQLIKAMRNRVQEEVNAAKRKLAAELAAASAEIESQTASLARDIARMIIEKPARLGSESRQ
jgi:F0F1-type ATP synthase membrane subunit b/b'